MSVFTLQKYNIEHYRHRNAPSGVYINHFNYFNKNNIKMSQIRQQTLDNTIKEKKALRDKLHMPKILHSHNFTENIPSTSTTKPDLSDLYGDYLYSSANNNNNNIAQDKQTSEHLNIFDDLFDCVANLEMDNPNDTNNNNANIPPIQDNTIINNGGGAQLKDATVLPTCNNDNNKVFITKITQTKETQSDDIDNPTTNNNNNSNNNNNNKQITILPKVVDTHCNVVNHPPVKTGAYHIRKHSQEGGSSILLGKQEDTKELQYLNYKRKVNNPSKVYNDIGSFNEKFNYELARISRSYGKEESKGRFVENPLLNEYREAIPFYDMYKDIKFIENRYADHKRFKYKLLPLVNAKLRNFDRLGERIYQNAINCKKGKLCIDTTNKKKEN